MPGRNHIDLVAMSLKVPRGEAGFWTIIRDLDAKAPWEVKDIADRTNTHEPTVREFVKRLLKGGFIFEAGERPSRSARPTASVKLFKLVRAPIDPPRLDAEGHDLGETKQQRMWRAMRIAKLFCADDVAGASSLDHDAVGRSTAQRYLNDLATAGILIRIRTDDVLGTVYRLQLDLGRLAPKILKARIVFDPNANAVVGTPEGKAVSS